MSWSASFAGHGGTTSTTVTRTGAGSAMKLTCPYLPRTITHLAPGARSAATRASWDGMAVSACGASTNAVSPAAATSRTAVIGENSGCSDSLLTSSTALAAPWRATR